MCIIYTLFQRK